MKTLYPLTVAAILFLINPIVHAAEYSTAIAGCKSAIEEKMAPTPLTHNILKSAKRQGAHKVNLFFEVYSENGSGEQVLNKVGCLAERQSGEVLEIAVE